MRLLLAVASLLALPVHAQDELEQVVVTGSRIARPDYDSASPIVSVTQELFERTASRTVEGSLNTLPQFVPAYTSTSNNPGNGGQANVSLRGLGPTSTLVLLDGKRLIPANGNGVADLNIIPTALIESVEIITGGASAVYGSDALAGVVNMKLRREFDGVQIDGTWAQTDRSDGTQYEASLTAGTDFAGGRGSIYGSVGYADRALVTHGERDFSRYALGYAGRGLGTMGPSQAFLPAGSQTIEEGRVQFSPNNLPSQAAFDTLMASYGYAADEVPFIYVPPDAPDNFILNRAFGFNTDGTVFTQGNFGFFDIGVPAVANFRGARDPAFFNEFAYTWNFAPPNALQLPLERVSAFLRGEFELGDATRIYAQGLYADYSATGRLAPTGFFDPVFIPISNPFMPDDLRRLAESRPNPGADLMFNKRLSELGPRVSERQYDVYQLTVGVSGKVFDDWDYEAYVQVGANEQEDRQSGNVLISRFEELTYAADGGVAICGGFDPFGLGSISPECLDYISVAAANHAQVDQTIAEVSMSGLLFALPAGDLRVAAGVFYKEDRYEYAASPVASVFVPFPGRECPPDCRQDLQGFSASQDIRGNDHNVDIYGEVLVPLLANIPGVRSLETVLGYRLSDYASAGSFDSWKAELLYRPVETIRVRGSFQEAVRAPSVYELNLPQLPASFEYFFYFEPPFEPCDFRSPERNGPDQVRVAELCAAQGVPEALLSTFQTPDLATGVAGGNPDLGPEEATTSTLGVVWTSGSSHRLLSSVQVSLDWYGIEIDDYIAPVQFGLFVSNCYKAESNPEFSAESPWCTYFDRDPVTGEMENVRELLRNTQQLETDGIDLQLDWRIDVGPGQVGANWLVAWVNSYEVSLSDSGEPAAEFVGTVGHSGRDFGVGMAIPEWKSNLHLSYAWGDLTVGATWRYIDSVMDANEDFQWKIPSTDYFDLNASYEVSAGMLAGLRFGIGVENLTDQDPPIFPSYIQANTDPSQYDVLGRRYFASLRYSF